MTEAAQRGTAAHVQDQFQTALAALLEVIRRDRSILAAILCGISRTIRSGPSPISTWCW